METGNHHDAERHTNDRLWEPVITTNTISTFRMTKHVVER